MVVVADVVLVLSFLVGVAGFYRAMFQVSIGAGVAVTVASVVICIYRFLTSEKITTWKSFIEVAYKEINKYNRYLKVSSLGF